MRMSTRGRYGCRALLDIAMHAGDGPVNLKEIAGRQNLSSDYLEQLLRRLRKAGLVKSVRGPRGGFVLSRPPEDIRLWDAVEALEQEIAPVFCVEAYVSNQPRSKPCPNAPRCAAHRLWAGLARQMHAYLESKTLRDLVNDFAQLREDARSDQCEMYDI